MEKSYYKNVNGSKNVIKIIQFCNVEQKYYDHFDNNSAEIQIMPDGSKDESYTTDRKDKSSNLKEENKIFHNNN